MPKGVFKLPTVTNEPIKSYSPGSKERLELKATLVDFRQKVVDIPMIIDGKEVRTNVLEEIRPPHDHGHLLGHYHQGDATHVQMAIEAALESQAEMGKNALGKQGCHILKSSRTYQWTISSKIECCHNVRTIQKCISS